MNIIFIEKSKNEFAVIDQNIGCEIGRVTLLFMDEKFWLNYIAVYSDDKQKKNSNGKKYGPAIVEYVVNNYKPFRISLSSKVSHSDDTRYLLTSGFKLVKTCFEEGILNRHNFSFPYPDELLDYKLDRFLNSRLSNILHMLNKINRMIKSLN